MKALVHVLLLFVALGACAAQSIDDIEIACNADGDCPDGAWCDLRYNTNVCRSLDGSRPPLIVYEGFVVADDVVPAISVPAKTLTFHSFRLRNDGSQTYVEVEVDAPACVDADSLVRSDGELLDEGKSLDADFTVRPEVGCPSPAMLTIDVIASDRPFTFTAMISITP